jgi:hypothetical protein
MVQVEGVAHGTTQPIQRVDHDDITGSRVAQQRLQPGPVGASPGLLVQVDLFDGDTDRGQRVDLPGEVLFGRRHPTVPKIHTRDCPEVSSARLL